MSFGGGGSSSGGTQVVQNEPYAPAQPALNQIISDASAIYGQGPQYVAPTQQQLQGLAAQENIANLANTEIANTISGQYSNPFLSPLIADVASSAYTNVAQQFSSAYNAERNRQLQTARAVPSLSAVGQELRGLEQERVMAPFENLQRFQSVIGPVASGLPSRQATQTYEANPIGMAAGGALTGAALGDMFGRPGMGAAIGGGFGLLGGLL
jgi:hypothetical protein